MATRALAPLHTPTPPRTPSPPIDSPSPRNSVKKIAVHALSQEYPDIRQLNEPFSQLSLDGQKKVFQIFQGIISARQDAEAVQAAILGGRGAVLALLRENKVDPSVDGNRLFYWAAGLGDDELAAMLLEDPRVDPSGFTQRYTLMSRGCRKTIPLLLAHPKYSLDDEEYQSWHIWASKNGHGNVVEILKKKKSELMTLKMQELKQKLLQLPLDEQLQMAQALQQNVDQEELLPIEEATQQGREAVIALLKEGKVNSSAGINALMAWAVFRANQGKIDEEIVQLLSEKQQTMAIRNLKRQEE